MSHPYLAFCPYLPVSAALVFGGWELGPAEGFEARWADPQFRRQSEAFLGKFVRGSGERIEHPALLCRHGKSVDGTLPAPEEIGALEAAITFAFLDQNPRQSPSSKHDSWRVITSDNTDLFLWPVDVEGGHVTVTTGLMVRTLGGGYRLSDPELTIRPPLDLHLPPGSLSADIACLEAIYSTVLTSLRSPGENPAADRLRAAIGWLAKAWRNTATVHFPERLVFLKTGFEALTGTSNSRESARRLRHLFEALPDTTTRVSEQLIWSPDEKPMHAFGKQQTDLLTDLELWFMAVANARNQIVHEGASPELSYSGTNAAWNGHLVFTAEFLLRAATKASLENLGFPSLWRSPLSKAIRLACDKLSASHEETGP